MYTHLWSKQILFIKDVNTSDNEKGRYMSAFFFRIIIGMVRSKAPVYSAAMANDSTHYRHIYYPETRSDSYIFKAPALKHGINGYYRQGIFKTCEYTMKYTVFESAKIGSVA